MLKTLSLAGAALAMTASALVPVTSASAQRGYYGGCGYARRCNDGTTGTVLGAIAGGLLGRTIDTRGDRTLGTVLGAGAGALAGRAVERSDRPGYCR
jgi:outer membrane lipoprotein SlyB